VYAPLDRAAAFSPTLGVTVVAAWRYLGAARPGIEGAIAPLDVGLFAHSFTRPFRLALWSCDAEPSGMARISFLVVKKYDGITPGLSQALCRSFR